MTNGVGPHEQAFGPQNRVVGHIEKAVRIPGNDI
jgi:hypothetical protein